MSSSEAQGSEPISGHHPIHSGSLDSSRGTDRTWAPRKPRQPQKHHDTGSHNPSASHGSSIRRGYRPRLPEAGEEVFGFRLIRELGRGSFARVFLAKQSHLAGRPVVLKVSTISGAEPWILAQLQHTHIVPIYSLHEDPILGLRAVCMPYFGGASLSDVRKELDPGTVTPTEGKELFEAIEKSMATKASEEQSEGEDEELPPNATSIENLAPWKETGYVSSVLWLVARLADGLQHAHDRGVLHRDVKPSNILLASDGRPMLLDFNISLPLVDGHLNEDADLSGTVTYMSPEQLQALATRETGLVQKIDCRSDLYSLGMVMYELLTGDRPFQPNASYAPTRTLVETMAKERREGCPSVKKKCPRLPWSLESIIRKCLSPDPDHRYQKVSELADDCRACLENRPLKHAPELSRIEVIQKWLRRHPRLISSAGVAAVAMLFIFLAVGAFLGAEKHLISTKAELAVAQALQDAQNHKKGTVQAVCLLSTFTDRKEHLQEGERICRETLRLFSVLDQDNWQQSSGWKQLPPDQQRQVAIGSHELLLLLAWSQVRDNPEDTGKLEEALHLLERAEKIQGIPPSKALWAARADYLQRLGRSEEAKAARRQTERLKPSTSHDHYLLATIYARQGRYDEAIDESTLALKKDPSHYWAAMQRGICYEELGSSELAMSDFSYCAGSWPEHPWSYFNRGYVRQKKGLLEEANLDYTTAIELDPSFTPAYWNRGMLALKREDHKTALKDLQWLLELGKEDVEILTGCGVALEGLGRTKQADSYFQKMIAVLPDQSEEIQIRCWKVYGFAMVQRLPDEAMKAFVQILRLKPDHAQALYGQAMLLVEQGEEDEAVGCFNRAIATEPGFDEARRFRAILLARRGELVFATQEVNACLQREDQAARKTGAAPYAAACVACLAAKQMTRPEDRQQVLNQALALLRTAFKRGYGRDQAMGDPDLTILHHTPELDRLLKETTPRKELVKTSH